MSLSYRSSSSYSSFRRSRSGSFGSSSLRYGSYGMGNFGRSRSYSSIGSSYYPSRPRYQIGRHRPTYDNCHWQSGRYNPQLITDDAHQQEVDSKPLVVDLCESANRKAHNTDLYETEQLVIRRGQHFDLTLTLGNGFDKNDKLKLQLTIGDTPQQSKGSLVRIPLVDKLHLDTWGYQIVSKNGTDSKIEVKLRVMPSVEALVGEWTMYVETIHKDSDDDEPEVHRYKHDKTLYVLFNPWCKDDTVYMEKSKERDEYVLNDTGRVYVGKASKITGRPWNFGQFEKVSLEATVYLLNNSYLATEGLGNVVQVVRALTAMANSNDQDNGVLSGNWTGNYSGGVAPTTWNGSVAILEQYMLNKRDVKFGQCWVFSGLVTTLCRAIGIPSRSVTNFDSAHDHDYSMTIDTHVDAEGKPISSMNDSIWNFHVWNEAWFHRRDLPDGNDGWQAFDATPQECSEGMMRCGPAPVVAVKEGNVFYGYDTKFIFAEVNGDSITWMVSCCGDDMMAIDVSTKAVGHFISTKAVGVPDRHDVTDNYKYPEGSEDERRVVAKVSKHSSRKDKLRAVYAAQRTNDVDVSFDGKSDVDGTLTLMIRAANKCQEPRDIVANIYAMAKYYTGVPGDDIDHNVLKVSLQPGETKDASWTLDPVVYLNRLDADASLGVHVMAKVTQTKQTFVHQQSFEVDKPDLDVQSSSSKVKVGEAFKVTVSFTNPLKVALTGCELHVEGPGVPRNQKIPLHRNLLPGKSDKEVFTMVPRLPGKREVIANLHAKQLTGIVGVVEIEVIQK